MISVAQDGYCDMVMVGTETLKHGVAALHQRFQEVQAAANGKIIISETGWPSCGEPLGSAVPSPENAKVYFLNLVSWACADDVPYVYFSGFDEAWQEAAEGPVGGCWGLRMEQET